MPMWLKKLVLWGSLLPVPLLFGMGLLLPNRVSLVGFLALALPGLGWAWMAQQQDPPRDRVALRVSAILLIILGFVFGPLGTPRFQLYWIALLGFGVVLLGLVNWWGALPDRDDPQLTAQQVQAWPATGRTLFRWWITLGAALVLPSCWLAYKLPSPAIGPALAWGPVLWCLLPALLSEVDVRWEPHPNAWWIEATGWLTVCFGSLVLWVYRVAPPKALQQDTGWSFTLAMAGMLGCVCGTQLP